MRLTERKVAYPNCDKQGNITQVNYIEIKDKKLAEEKLCQLEDIEDELGIDLITLFKALKNGIWIKNTILKNGETKNLLFFYEDVNLYKDCLYACPVDIYDEKVCIDQYRETWALTKEELENDN